MRPIEERYLSDVEAEKRAASEMHRFAYVYYLNRLTDVFRGGEAVQSERHDEIHGIAALCRRERAAHLGVSEAEADRVHGTVIEMAQQAADADSWVPCFEEAS